MSIKSVSDFQTTLQNANTKGWTSKNSNIDLESGKIGGIDSKDGEVKTFGDFLKESVAKVNSLQNEANVAIEKLASGESKSIHETLLAVEKADIAFKTMNQIRQKVIEGYKEIMRMQI